MTNEFPSRRVCGVAMVLGPLLLLTGTLLRSPYNFFFPDQLAAAADHPVLMNAAYTAFTAGNVLMVAAVAGLARAIGGVWGAWGGVLVLVGLIERTFHSGVDHAAFSVLRHSGLEAANTFVANFYTDQHLFTFLSFTIMFGWYVLAVGAYRTLGLVRAIALATMGLLPLGVLKGTELVSIAGTVGLCVALVPLGIKWLREAPRLSRRTVLIAIPATLGVAGLAFLSTMG
ncbi:hypothetical protein [Kibdelosporangium phytohabitans]|uniref:DUF4386 domain-containing protein n=1 Tax=Kibdelosporangium phytohabitans TaxID=860235 RepID=A0A0N9IGS3_9PSEU|nr:hypothetical protein [Kibdelosporangium phytohabitans]ALG14128.1 hypothetical protein AOZ06_51180 [Kibdelosporangium phytohabitans]MBE1466886.1 hypothetical protein [Kibdelosporangium phytohabitans]